MTASYSLSTDPIGAFTLVAAKLGIEKEKKKIEVESLGIEPVRLTDTKREK